jgi:hypothetical protein
LTLRPLCTAQYATPHHNHMYRHDQPNRSRSATDIVVAMRLKLKSLPRRCRSSRLPEPSFAVDDLDGIRGREPEVFGDRVRGIATCVVDVDTNPKESDKISAHDIHWSRMHLDLISKPRPIRKRERSITRTATHQSMMNTLSLAPSIISLNCQK